MGFRRPNRLLGSVLGDPPTVWPVVHPDPRFRAVLDGGANVSPLMGATRPVRPGLGSSLVAGKYRLKRPGTQEEESRQVSKRSKSLNELLNKARTENLIIRSADGDEFILAEIDDFDREIQLARKNRSSCGCSKRARRRKRRFRWMKRAVRWASHGNRSPWAFHAATTRGRPAVLSSLPRMSMFNSVGTVQPSARLHHPSRAGPRRPGIDKVDRKGTTRRVPTKSRRRRGRSATGVSSRVRRLRKNQEPRPQFPAGGGGSWAAKRLPVLGSGFT